MVNLNIKLYIKYLFKTKKNILNDNFFSFKNIFFIFLDKDYKFIKFLYLRL